MARPDAYFERDKRFVEVADACALIRLGLYARSISEPGPVEKTHAKRGRYIWGVGVTEEQLSDGPVREARSDTQDPLGVTYSSSPTSELEGLVRKLALGASRGFQRTATVLGPEGSGKTDVVGKLEERLKKELDDKSRGGRHPSAHPA